MPEQVINKYLSVIYLYNYFFRRVIKINYPEWINDAEELYKKGFSFSRIGKQLQVDRKQVSYYLQKKGYIPNHKFLPKTKVKQKHQKNINENIFEKIDTEEKAYWLGFLMADGYVSEKTNRIELALQEQDYEHVLKFKEFLESDHNITKKVKDNKYVSYRLAFSNKKIKEDLISHGCIPNKTKQMVFPTTVPKELIRHFIRGYFDADGCITSSKTSGTSFELLGYDDLLNGVLEFFNIEGHIYTFNHSDVKRFMIAGEKARKILDILYKDSTIYLDRKYDKYLKHCRSKSKSTEDLE